MERAAPTIAHNVRGISKTSVRPCASSSAAVLFPLAAALRLGGLQLSEDDITARVRLIHSKMQTGCVQRSESREDAGHRARQRSQPAQSRVD